MVTKPRGLRRKGPALPQQPVPPPPPPPPPEEPAIPELVHLKTTEEVLAARETVEVYIVRILAKTSNETVTALKVFVPQMELQHLRRLARPHFLPPSVSEKLPPTDFPEEQGQLYLLIGQTDCASVKEIMKVLRTTSSFKPTEENGGRGRRPAISVIKVPKHMPTSEAQAEEWSVKYWPTVYKRGNPFGPHPSIVENTVQQLGRAGEYLAIARRAARESAMSKVGYGIGGVIVNPKNGEIIAVAGDARLSPNGDKPWCNPLDHAVLRLISMVAQKRLKDGNEVSPNNPVKALTNTESQFFPGLPSNLPEGANPDDEPCDGDYLCHKLQVFLTHEPCIMCSMALLHSRVGCVVFEKVMDTTGALQPDGAKGDHFGYGIFWRPDLNWKYHCFRYNNPDYDPVPEVPDNLFA
ncbi:cytidine deaminase-like protein [Geopyxis carbonaria]|nr:cytidine deaminase-like protein [Geopyxis carbonaria]